MKKRRPGTGFAFEEEPSDDGAFRRQIEEANPYDLIYEDDDPSFNYETEVDYHDDENSDSFPPDCDVDAEDCCEQLDCDLILRECCVSGQECQECRGFLKCEEIRTSKSDR